MSRPIRRELKVTLGIFATLAFTVATVMVVIENPVGTVCWGLAGFGMTILALAFGD